MEAPFRFCIRKRARMVPINEACRIGGKRNILFVAPGIRVLAIDPARLLHLVIKLSNLEFPYTPDPT